MTQIPTKAYESLKGLAIAAIICLSIVSLINLFAAVFYLAEATFGGFSTPINALVVFKPLAFLLTVIFFLIWLNRANKNLTALKADNLEFSSGWAVGWWFIPFANLVKPFQVVREIWVQSDPDFDPDLQFMSGSAGAPNYMGAWWALYIISNIAANAANQLRPADTASYSFYLYSWTIVVMLSFAAGLFAIKLVWDITQRQERRFQRLGTLAETFQQPPPPPVFNENF